MRHVQSWFTMVVEVLESGEEAALGLIRAAAPRARGGAGVVELIEGPTSSLDALAYAQVLIELGRRWEAEEIVRAVICAEHGAPVPLGSQQLRGDVPQGAQIVA